MTQATGVPRHTPPLILIANDQEWSARSLESIIVPNGYAVLRAYTGRQALERARQSRPDLIILDAQMPDLHGVEVCRQLRQDPDFGAIVPILISTAGPSGRAQRLEAYRAGAWEFLGQPIDGESLLLKLQAYLAAKREADERSRAGLLDEGTGLYNEEGLSRRIREVAAEVHRRGGGMSCVVFSPRLNDGSPLPAPLTNRLGALLREHGRSSDAIGRVSDREYAVIAPGTEAEGARQLVARLETLLQKDELTGASPVHLQAGCAARRSPLVSSEDPLELLSGATRALRALVAEGGSERVRDWTPGRS